MGSGAVRREKQELITGMDDNTTEEDTTELEKVGKIFSMAKAMSKEFSTIFRATFSSLTNGTTMPTPNFGPTRALLRMNRQKTVSRKAQSSAQSSRTHEEKEGRQVQAGELYKLAVWLRNRRASKTIAKPRLSHTLEVSIDPVNVASIYFGSSARQKPVIIFPRPKSR